ncbi:MAG: hypothetical protein JW943_15120 [Deltaproteobacteria bacterium]|nr:hypothetical protein [Deltaproteobacteria bacterium]
MLVLHSCAKVSGYLRKRRLFGKTYKKAAFKSTKNRVQDAGIGHPVRLLAMLTQKCIRKGGKNPLTMGMPGKAVGAASGESGEWDGCDAVIHLGAVGREYMIANMIKAIAFVNPGLPVKDLEFQSTFIKDGEKMFFDQTIKLMEQYQKPIVGVRLLDYEGSNIISELPGKDYKGVSFLTPERAVNVLARTVEYHDWLKRNMD